MKFSDIIESLNNDKWGFTEVTPSEFDELLSELTTLDLEDDQVRYPRSEGRGGKYIFGGRGYSLFLLDRNELPISGPFEIIIEDSNSDDIIGFIRATKHKNIISINLIHILEEKRGWGIGSDIYEKFLNSGLIIKSDTEITDSTYSLYYRLMLNGFKPLIFNDDTVGLMK